MTEIKGKDGDTIHLHETPLPPDKLPPPPYQGARKIPVVVEEQANGQKTIKFGAVGDVKLDPYEQVMVYWSPGLPFLHIYTFRDLREIVGWMKENQQLVDDKHKVRFEEDEPLEESVVETTEEKD